MPAPDLDDVARELRDSERVLVGLGGETDEEVQLHPSPALRVGPVDRAVEIFLPDQLVDHLAQAPRARFGSEREARPANLLDLARDADGEGVDPQRRQRQAHVAASVLVVHEIANDVVSVLADLAEEPADIDTAAAD